MPNYFDDDINISSWSSAEITSRKIPICLVLDRSGSMSEPSGHRTKIQELNNNMKNFLSYVKNNEKARRLCDICIIAFGGADQIDVVCGYANIKDVRYTELTPYGRTPLGAAVNKALELLRLRRNYYKQNYIEHYKPIMLMMSDGVPTDAYTEAAKEISSLVRKRELKVFPVGIGKNFNKEVLRKFSPEVEPKVLVGSDDFAMLFKLLSASSSNPNDDSLDKWFNDEA